MSEIKPNKDDTLAGDDTIKVFKISGDTAKPHGDKLQHAVDEAAENGKKR